MKAKINSIIIFLSVFVAFALTTITESAAAVTEGIISLENVWAQQNSTDSGSRDTELGGDTELCGNTGMSESDLGGEDIGMTVSDLENDTDIANNNQTD
jgi:hypothetical protein